MLETAENKEGNAEEDAKRRAKFVHFYGEIHDDAAEERFDKEGEGEVVGSNFFGGGFDERAVGETEKEADEVAGDEVHDENDEEIFDFQMAFEEETAFSGEEIKTEVADAE